MRSGNLFNSSKKRARDLYEVAWALWQVLENRSKKKLNFGLTHIDWTEALGYAWPADVVFKYRFMRE